MSNDNRVSASLTAQDMSDILDAIAGIRAKLPFLLTLSSQDSKELAKMGDKSVGFDDKCNNYMTVHPEFLPGFVDINEVAKDRALREQMMRVFVELDTLADTVDDTLKVICSEIWMADLAYYQSVREAAKRNRAGAQSLYDDLRQRFPGSSPAASAAAAAAKAKPAIAPAAPANAAA